MGPDPPYIPAKFGDDTLKSSKVMDKKLQKFDAADLYYLLAKFGDYILRFEKVGQ